MAHRLGGPLHDMNRGRHIISPSHNDEHFAINRIINLVYGGCRRTMTGPIGLLPSELLCFML